jgi:hypothetical protein
MTTEDMVEIPAKMILPVLLTWRVRRLPCRRLFAGSIFARGGLYLQEISFVFETAGFSYPAVHLSSILGRKPLISYSSLYQTCG